MACPNCTRHNHEFTQSDLFKAAHALTRAIRRPGDDYRATFGSCLRYLSEIVRAAQASHWVDAVSRWTKAGRDRLYINYHSQNRFAAGADWIDLTDGTYHPDARGDSGAKTAKGIAAFRDAIGMEN